MTNPTSAPRSPRGPSTRMPGSSREPFDGIVRRAAHRARRSPRGRCARGNPSPPRGRSRRRCSACRLRIDAARFCRCSSRSVTLTIISPPPCHGGIGFENFRAAVKRADAGRRTHFVAGEGEEIATELLHIDRQMPGALRGIDERDRRRLRARCAAQLGDGIDRAERVRDVGEGEQLHLRREQRVELIERERAVLVAPARSAAARRSARPAAATARDCCGAPSR